MPFSRIDPGAVGSPPGSPRSSASSCTNACSALLTPLDELDRVASEMVIADPHARRISEGGDAPELAVFAAAIPQPADKIRSNLSLAVPPPPAFPTLAFAATSPTPPHASLSPSYSGPASPGLPAEAFTFGTCPSVPFLGTPVAEQGPFEYPDLTGSSSSPHGSASSGSLSPRDPPFAHAIGANVRLSTSSTSSTSSTITPFPIPDCRPSTTRRPSSIHSTSSDTSVPLIVTPVSPVGTPLPTPTPTHCAPAHSAKRSSTLMFQQKALPAPIPPSLLARRGSLPAAQLFGLPLREQQHWSRSNAPVVTTAALYQRRQSVVSEAEEESVASGAMAAEGGLPKPRSTRASAPMIPTSPTSPTSAESQAAGYTHEASSTRRGSLPFISPPILPTPPTRSSAPSRSRSITSPSSRPSLSTRRPPTSFRNTVPANFFLASPMPAPTPAPTQRRPPLKTSVSFSPSSRSGSSDRQQ